FQGNTTITRPLGPSWWMQEQIASDICKHWDKKKNPQIISVGFSEPFNDQRKILTQSIATMLIITHPDCASHIRLSENSTNSNALIQPAEDTVHMNLKSLF